MVYEDGSEHSHCKRTGHAERNAITQAARKGSSTKGSTLYCTMEPCIDCANDIINAGIVRVVALHRYHGAKVTREWFAHVGIALKVVNDEHAKYESGPVNE
jgi:dCMP deaminase